MAQKLGPVISGSAQLVQQYGANPTFYAKFGLKGHEGIDLSAPAGRIVAAAHSGWVVYAGDTGGAYGNAVVVFNQNSHLMSLYAHLQEIEVTAPKGEQAQHVREGDMLGRVGSTGQSTGNHLHFSVARTKPGSYALLNLGGKSFTVEEKVHPGNGYGGWENPLNSSLFAFWPIWLSDLPTPKPDPSMDVTVIGVEVEGETLSFDNIFAQYYIGWGRVEAEANFRIEFNSEIDKLLVARGLKPGEITVEEKPRPKPPAQTYFIKPKWAGKSLKQIFQETGTAVRLDLLSGFIAIPENEPIEATRQFNTAGFPDFFDVGSGEVQFFNKYFWTTQPPAEKVIRMPAPIGEIPSPPEEEEVPESAQGPEEPEDITEPPEAPPEAPPGAPPPSEATAEILELLNQILAGQTDILDKLAVAPGEPLPTPPAPEKQTAAVFIETTPRRASIYIDDQWQADYTPSNSSHLLAAGEHTIRLKKKGYKDYKEVITLTSGQVLEMAIELEPE